MSDRFLEQLQFSALKMEAEYLSTSLVPVYEVTRLSPEDSTLNIHLRENRVSYPVMFP
jgi:hypothetical protein